ncbi:hypothetical protein ACVWW1_006185 [Bradyrhizobium sp. JR3.5]
MTIPVPAAEPEAVSGRKSDRPRKRRSKGVDVGAVITRALTAAGLMK